MIVELKLDHLVDEFQKTLRRLKPKPWSWLLGLLLAAGWCFVVASSLAKNQYGYYSLTSLARWLILLPILAVPSALVVDRLLTWLGQLPARRCASLLASACLASLFIVLVIPMPLPALVQPHHVQIINRGERNPESQGAVLEIRQIRFLDRRTLQLDRLQLSGDWQIVKDRLVSEGKSPESAAELNSPMPGGIVLSLRYNDNAGKVTVVWDGKAEEFDLFAPRGVTVDKVFSGWATGNRSAQAWAWLVGTFLLYLIAFAGVLLGLAYWLDYRWAGTRRASIALGILYLAVFVIFLQGKLTYPRFSAERTFRDTTSYVTTSQAPLNSREFWAGERPFTIPLVYKAFGVNTANVTEPQKLNQVASFQFWLSIVAWTLLGLAVARGLRNQWLKPLAFGLILALSLSLEVSLWDSLLLSESISLSLFALLLGSWLFWDALPVKGSSVFLSIAYLAGVMLLTVLYSFTRESNPYFVLVGGVIFGLAVLIRRAKAHLRRYCAAYAVFVIGMFILQTLSFAGGNRWVIHIYDQLGLRLLEDKRAYQYFVSAGLPVTPDLMKITAMPATEYQAYLQSAPEMQAVRDWVAERGNTTYLGYLLADPLDAALEPLSKMPILLNGTNLEYHYPRYAVPTIPSWLEDFSDRVYPRGAVVLLAFFGLGLFITVAYFWGARPAQTSWLVLAVLVLSLYPLLFIVWHGNPMELERHATQLAVQLRLAGWMAVILGLDVLASLGL